MFWDKFFKKETKKETVGEPVLTLVRKVKENPKKHDLRFLGESHIVFYYNGDVDWQFSVFLDQGDVYTNDQARWMNNAEKLYVCEELFRYALPCAIVDPFSRSGWMKKVMGEDNATS